MNRRGVWVVMVMSALMVLVCVPKAWGQRPADVEPLRGTVEQKVVQAWDRASIPGEIVLLPARTVLGNDLDVTKHYRSLHLVCDSEHDSRNGRCLAAGNDENGSGHSRVLLEFVEQRSGLTTAIDVVGYLQRIESVNRCEPSFWSRYERPIWTRYGAVCGASLQSGTGVALSVPASSLEALVAGRWTASLRLNLRSSIESFATYIFNFDFTITDHNAASIYFPQFESTTPLVNLDARYDPIQQTVGGRTVVDMCLYDGLGSQASYLAVTARDISPRSAGNSGFSLWHDSSGSDPSQRLDYTVTLDHNGARVPLSNGVEEQLTGIDSSQLRLVMLPGMSQPVFCVNTPMTLDMPRVPSTSKRSGIYWGDLQLELRVPAGTP